MTISGTFQIIDWKETILQQLDDKAKLTSAVVKQTYSGTLQGGSETTYLMCYAQDGNATFTGFEVLTSQVDSIDVKLILKHDGKFVDGIASSQFVVLQSIPECKFIGKTGHFTSGEAGQAEYSLA